VFLFVTGDNPSEIIHQAQKLDIPENSLCIQSATHTEVATYISLFNASVFFILPAYSKKASSPTKQGELMSMGIPIICNAGVGDTDKLIEKYKAGLVIQEMNEHNFSLLDWDYIPFDKSLARKGAEEFYGLENGVKKYFQVYQKLLA
ncbi:MAG: hypothetical protein RLZ10_2107, partial [Bacteroidota bacterium]